MVCADANLLCCSTMPLAICLYATDWGNCSAESIENSRQDWASVLFYCRWHCEQRNWSHQWLDLCSHRSKILLGIQQQLQRKIGLGKTSWCFPLCDCNVCWVGYMLLEKLAVGPVGLQKRGVPRLFRACQVFHAWNLNFYQSFWPWLSARSTAGNLVAETETSSQMLSTNCQFRNLKSNLHFCIGKKKIVVQHLKSI